MGFRSIRRRNQFGGRSSNSVDVSPPLLSGGIRVGIGLVFGLIGICVIAQGNAATETFGWGFAIMGAILVFVGIVVGIALWPKRGQAEDE